MAESSTVNPRPLILGNGRARLCWPNATVAESSTYSVPENRERPDLAAGRLSCRGWRPAVFLVSSWSAARP